MFNISPVVIGQARKHRTSKRDFGLGQFTMVSSLAVERKALELFVSDMLVLVTLSANWNTVFSFW
jgi:hypothetical protein